jgi:hypothetical protein
MTIFSINSGSFGDVTVTGIVSASTLKGDGSQITSVSYDNIASKPTLISSSTQVTSLLPTGSISSSAQINYPDISNIPANIVSSSGQVTALLPANTVSSSGQISLSGISGTTFSNNDFSFPLNVTVNGLLTATSQSIIYITSSQLNVGSNDIVLNTTEQLRFGGLTVFDSGSANQSGSLFWDSLHNVWLYVHAGTSNTSSIVITGPENTGVLGSEQFLTPNRVPKAGLIGDHIVDSQISDNGTTVGISGNLSVTGSITAASVTASVSGALTGTLQTAAQTNVTSLGTLSSLTVSGDLTVDTSTLKVDSTNNIVGIGGTATAGYGLQILGPTSANLFTQEGVDKVKAGVRASGRTGISFDSSDATYTNRMWFIDNFASAGSLIIGRPGLDAVRIDNSGNLGLGVTPSAWGTLTALQVKNAAFSGFSNSAYLTANTYYDGSNFKYIASTFAAQYRQQDGQHIFYTAASGTAGNTITFTQAMTLDASGNVGIGTTNPRTTFHVYNGVGGGTATEALRLQDVWGTTGDGPLIRFTNYHVSGTNPNSTEYNLAGIAGIDDNASWGGSLLFYTAPTGTTGGANLVERVRIIASGNVGIGTTSPSQQLEVTGKARISTGLAISDNIFDYYAGTVTFTDGESNKAFDIRFGNISFWGYLEVEINSTYNNQNATGKLTKIFTIGTNPNNNIYTNESRVSDAIGTIDDNIAIGDFAWDSTNSTYKIPVSHIVSTGNTFTVRIKMFSGGNTAIIAFNNISLSSVYTLTALSKQYPYYNDRLGIGTTNPSAKLEVAGDGADIIKGSRVGITRFVVKSAANSVGINTDTVNNALTVNGNADFSGNVGIGTTSPSYLLDVRNTTSTSPVAYLYNSATNGRVLYLQRKSGDTGDYFIVADNVTDNKFLVNGAGTIYAVNTTVQSVSDIAFKENIRDLELGLKHILDLKPRRFDWKEGKGLNEKNTIGFIAQEVEESIPDIVKDDWKVNMQDDKVYKSLGMTNMIPVLVKAMQEQQQMIETLKAEVAELKTK